MTAEERGKATALAGACIAAATLDLLLSKELITIDEARGVLNNAMRKTADSLAPEAFAANEIIGEMLRGRFNARK